MAKLLIALDQLKAFKAEFDEQMKKYPIVCKKGCTYCCYQWVPVMSFEVNYIKDAIKNLHPKIRDRVKEQYLQSMQHFMDHTPDRINLTFQEVYKDYAQLVGNHWIACPLLVDDKCSIYEMRPFTCQLHFQLDDWSYCKENNVRDADQSAIQMMGQLVNFLLKTGDFHLVPILYILKDVFEKKRKVKIIESQKYTL